ncbi:MAG: shikimate dehydrogenase [Cyanobacteria bacterium P01_G01_bin.54]
MPDIHGTTQLLGIIGHPVEHSLSPIMQNAALMKLGVDYAYLPFPVAPEQLAAALAGMAAIAIQGFNVTIPHKQAILPLLDRVTPLAQQIGAVNTVWRSEQGWQGTNTDVAGFIAPLQQLERDWQQITPVVLGNGGAARAVVVGLVKLGCPRVVVVGRTPEKLVAFEQSWTDAAIRQCLTVQPWNRLDAWLAQSQLLVNTTPLGMAPQVNQSPLTPAQLAQLPAGAIAYDLIYTPRPTRFLTQAQAARATIIDGTEMLVQQGAAALSQWLGQPAPVAVMRQALLGALGEIISI